MLPFRKVQLLLLAATILAAGCQSVEYEYEVRTDVPNKAFYKDLLMDTGLWMSEYRTMPVVDYLSLDYEYFYAPESNDENQALQDLAFIGSDEDLNGVLLYPDGEPRFKMIYVNGGLASYHGRSLRAQGRNNFRKFIMNGGGYIGSCAGAFMASYGIDEDNETMRGYLGIWPGLANNTNDIVNLAYDLPEESPALKYYDFGGDRHIDVMKHYNGPFFSKWDSVEGTEVIAINKAEGYILDGQAAVIAYKADVFSGTVIPSGGHPEQVPDGEGRDLMASYVRYAMDGLGAARVKAVLNNGEVRMMDKSTEDDDPLFTMIGDNQCHHFVFALPEGATDVKVRLESLKECNLSLFLANGTFAFREDAQYKVESGENVKELSFDNLDAGLWYIGVQSEESVECNFGEHGYEYYGKTWLLNGAPYSISVSWKKGRKAPSVKITETASSGNALLATGSDFNEYLKQLVDAKATVVSADSTIRRIAFRANDPSTDGIRVDDIRSSVPIYASLGEEGTVTVTTSAAAFYSNVDASYMFADFTSLESIDNLAAVNTSSSRFFNGMFSGCGNLEDLDITAFDMSNSRTTVDMFDGCKLLKRFIK